MARNLAQAFAENNCTVVSGLALGCDTAAHEGALLGGGRTIAVLGCGIRVIHPRENLELARRIAEHGCIISEQPPDARPSVARLMARNRLQAVLARGVIVVQSGLEGGAMSTAAIAVKHRRLLYAVKWQLLADKMLGNEKLFEEGARPVRGVGDVPAVCQALAARKQLLLTRKGMVNDQMKLFN